MSALVNRGYCLLRLNVPGYTGLSGQIQGGKAFARNGFLQLEKALMGRRGEQLRDPRLFVKLNHRRMRQCVEYKAPRRNVPASDAAPGLHPVDFRISFGSRCKGSLAAIRKKNPVVADRSNVVFAVAGVGL